MLSPCSTRALFSSTAIRFARDAAKSSLLGGQFSTKMHSTYTCKGIGDHQLSQNYVTCKGGRMISPSQPFSTQTKPTELRRRAFVSFGSNVGDRLRLIEEAYTVLRNHEKINITRTSGLWETKAMYVTDQNDFLNGVFELETNLEPHDLLDALQDVENSFGRVRTMAKGPRTLDLDIVLYENTIIGTDRLTVPHLLMLERPFVLKPLCQLIPQERHPADEKALTFAVHLQNLPKREEQESTITPLSTSDFVLTPLVPSRKTEIMVVLNITPDSFSDGGVHSVDNLATLETYIRTHIAAGATILDVGGQSTRPNAASVTSDDEIARVVPVIKLIRSIISTLPSDIRKPVISIDTYRAAVAEAAITAGADIVNDVSGGTLDPAMLSTVAALRCTFILMHMRGDPSTMMSAENTSYPNGVVETVGAELVDRVAEAEAAGIPRWRIVLDPGIGFAKNGTQNCELLRRLGELRMYEGLQGIPWLVGSSRKSFVGKITGVSEASERVWGTAATVAAAVQGGAEVVRVHDVAEMAQVAKMSDAIWRV